MLDGKYGDLIVFILVTQLLPIRYDIECEILYLQVCSFTPLHLINDSTDIASTDLEASSRQPYSISQYLY